VSDKEEIKKMIEVRKKVGLHSDSDVQVTNTSGYYESVGIGKCGELICRVGTWSNEPEGYELACNGDGWAYYVKMSGDACEVITPPDSGPSPIGTLTIRFKAPEDWTTVNIWAWDLYEETSNYTGGTWPGVPMDYIEEGYYEIVLTDVEASFLGVVINDGRATGAEQTVDLETTGSICWEATEKNASGKYEVSEDTSCKPTNIKTVEKSSFSVYPNPVRDVLNIITEKEMTGIEVTTITGGLVKISSEKEIRVSDLSSGLYMLKINFTDGSSVTEKFIKY
ncbi:MAG: starch-binding protein, partial [Candidatus Azobacteroides sp.]|nr:starch-binding protein [Candidatus Azobacteroides sp.]